VTAQFCLAVTTIRELFEDALLRDIGDSARVRIGVVASWLTCSSAKLGLWIMVRLA
jgi:hypothetical protein